MNSILSFLLLALFATTTCVNATLGNPLVIVKSEKRFITSKIFGNHLYASIFGNNQLHQYDAQTGKFIRSFPSSHIASITDIKVIGDFIYTASDDSSVKLWSISRMQRLKTFDGHNNPISALELSPNGKFMFSAAGKEGSVVMWDTQEGRIVNKFQVSEFVTDLIASPDSRRVYIISIDSIAPKNSFIKVTEWDYTTGRKLRVHSFKGYKSPFTASQRQTAVYGNGNIYMLATLYKQDASSFLNHVIRFDLNAFKPVDTFTPFLTRGEVTDLASFSLGRLGVYMMTFAGNLWRVNFDFNNLVFEKTFPNNDPGFNEYIDQSPGGNRLWVCKGNQLSAFAI